MKNNFANISSAHDHWMARKDNRPTQMWKKRTKTGKVSRHNAAPKGEIGAIPVRKEI